MDKWLYDIVEMCQGKQDAVHWQDCLPCLLLVLYQTSSSAAGWVSSGKLELPVFF